MTDAGETSTAVYGGESQRGGGGKLRRERKPPSTPYDRPPRGGRWISRFVDPAKRLFSGLPSLFSPFPSSNIADEVQLEEEQEAGDDEGNFTADLEPKSTVEVGSSEAKGKSKLDVSDEDRRGSCSDGGVPDIEKLIKGNTFSKEDIDHLMKILHSKVADADQEKKTTPRVTGFNVVEKAETSRERQKLSLSEEGELNRFQLATSTPLPRSAMQDGIGASPVDLARAYMGSRASEMGFASTSLVPKNEKFGSTSEFPSKPVMPSPLPKAPICWPGAVTQNQLDYSTPQSRNPRSGLHSFSRTPYSRTIFSKSKSKLTPLRGDNDKFPSISPAPSQPTATPAFGKSMNNVVDTGYGSGGPLRRMRNKFSSATPIRKATMLSAAERSPWAREPNVDFMPKKIYEPGSSSNANFPSSKNKVGTPEAGIHNVHPHSNKLAREILEQLDRPITLKERSNELKLAASWKDSSAAPVQNISSPSIGGAAGSKSKDFDGVKHSVDKNGESDVVRQERTNISSSAGKDMLGAKTSQDNTNTIFGVNNGSSLDPERPNSQKSSQQGVDNNLPKTSFLFSDPSKGKSTINNPAKPEPQNAHRKPNLPSIAIEKSGMRTSFASATNSSFTFSFSTPSMTTAEPPTPSIMPSFLTSSPQQSKVSATAPMFTSGNKITIAPPVIAFPSTTMPMTSKDVSAPKFKFGSGKHRLSFATEGDDAASTQNDAAIPKFKFGSDRSRLNFGSVASDALCY